MKTSWLDFGFWPNFPQPRERKDYQCKKGYWCNTIPIKVCNEGCPGSNVQTICAT